MTRPIYPGPGEYAVLIRNVCQDLLATVPMYHRLHAMGAEAERGEHVNVSGGGEGDPTGSAVESEVLAHHRDSARYLAKEVGKMGRKADRLRQWLEHDIGPGPGYRQPQSIGSDAVISVFEFAQGIEKQRDRLKRGDE